MQVTNKFQRYDFGSIPKIMEMPHLLDIQRESFQWFLDEGLLRAFKDISPIEDFTGNMTLEFIDYNYFINYAFIISCFIVLLISFFSAFLAYS